ncbi:D-ribose pyranase [Cryobacterium frigoriphilum]|uniref:D-ribose pyranase n=1 Tax=Cryobacterium frigoriphilum TaxID=1259150 RepID=A0A4R8ZVN5_9MICO|nr:D-ribose pyranase [Cryobacterium frigoriphilum]TFD47284.1 D-ribose pyranase [Cryobacterium frigoriphilum]
MRRRGILNADLNAALSRLGHTDLVIVADCGLPIPRGVPVIDLALVHGVPRFEQVLDALLEELAIDRAVVAVEVQGTLAHPWLTTRFEHLDYIDHTALKTLSESAALFIRTGEATPYANAALVCGVGF